MKKMKICGIFLLCMLVAGCSTDIEQEVVDNSETEQESIETEAEQETGRRDLYEEDEAEDEIIDFRLVEGSLYNKVNRKFEYEKRDSVWLSKFPDNDYWFSNADGGWKIFPEYFGDYDGDGEKDIVYINSDSFWSIEYPYINETADLCIHKNIGSSCQYDLNALNYFEIYNYFVDSEDNTYYVREMQNKISLDESENNYYYNWSIDIYNLTESIKNKDSVLEKCLNCSEYFEDSKLVNSCLRIATDVQKNNSWTYLYCNYDNHDSKTKYKKFSYAANEMKQEIDNYIDQYRNGSNVQPICAFDITPTYSDLKEEEINGGGSKIKNISEMKIAYNNGNSQWNTSLDNWEEKKQEILEISEQSNWIDKYAIEVNNKIIDRIGKVHKWECENKGNKSVYIYTDDFGNIDQLTYEDIFDADIKADIRVYFYFNSNKIIGCDLEFYKSDEYDYPENDDFYGNLYSVRERCYVKDGYVYRISDDFSFNEMHDVRISLKDMLSTDWWSEICDDIKDRVPNALTESDVSENVKEVEDINNVEEIVGNIRTIYNEIEKGVIEGEYQTNGVNNVDYCYDNGELVLVIDVSKKDGYSKRFYYKDGELIFAYYEGDDAHRFYFNNDHLIRWRYASDANIPEKAENHDLEQSIEYKEWEEKVLSESNNLKMESR